MALVPHSSPLKLWTDSAVSTVSRWLQGITGHRDFSPEEALAETPGVDPRLLPRTAMTAENIDVNLLSELGKLGFKRGKLITEKSHPELMQAWQAMSARAGLDKPPQLILTESKTVNALTVSPEEVVVSTGLFKLLNLREVTAVLGHELGHENSKHTQPRILANAVLGGAGALLGDRYARRGGIGAMLQTWVKGEGKFKDFLNWKFGAEAKPVSLLGTVAYIGIGAFTGHILANQLTVRPTELQADEKGAAISGDPQGLIDALRKLDASRPKKPVETFFSYVQSGYPSTQKRIENLERIASQRPAPLGPQPLPVASAQPPLIPGHAVSHVAADPRVMPEPASPTLH